MKPELYWLVCTVTMTGLFWLPYILNRLKEMKLVAVMDADASTVPAAPWAKRMMAAHRNAIENLAIFAPLVLVINAQGISTPATAQACMIYFYARMAHFIVYTAGIPLLRTITFAVGFACQMVLASLLLSL